MNAEAFIHLPPIEIPLPKNPEWLNNYFNLMVNVIPNKFIKTQGAWNTINKCQHICAESFL